MSAPGNWKTAISNALGLTFSATGKAINSLGVTLGFISGTPDNPPASSALLYVTDAGVLRKRMPDGTDTAVGGGGGAGVESVTGLNTDNTDPLNPIVQVSVDGSTITGAGTPGDPLVATAGGGSDPELDTLSLAVLGVAPSAASSGYVRLFKTGDGIFFIDDTSSINGPFITTAYVNGSPLASAGQLSLIAGSNVTLTAVSNGDVTIDATVDPDISCTTLTTTGNIDCSGTGNIQNVNSVTAAGTISGDTLSAASFITGSATASIVDVIDITAAGEIAGDALTIASGGIASTGHITSSGNVTAVDGIFTGDMICENATVNGTLSVGSAISASATASLFGGIRTGISAKTDSDSPYGVTVADSTILANPAVATTLTCDLLPANSQPGRIYTFKLIGLGTLVIDANGSETIDGAATVTVTTLNASVTIQSDGSNWYIIG